MSDCLAQSYTILIAAPRVDVRFSSIPIRRITCLGNLLLAICQERGLNPHRCHHPTDFHTTIVFTTSIFITVCGLDYIFIWSRCLAHSLYARQAYKCQLGQVLSQDKSSPNSQESLLMSPPIGSTPQNIVSFFNKSNDFLIGRRDLPIELSTIILGFS